MLLSIILSAGCDKIIPDSILDRETIPSSLEEGLAGVWETTTVATDTSDFLVYNSETASWDTIVKPGENRKISKTGPYYTILKFQDGEVYSLASNHYLAYSTLDRYPYTIEPDSTINSEIFKLLYPETTNRITLLTSKRMEMEVEEKGRIRTSTGEAGDTIALGMHILLTFQKLR